MREHAHVPMILADLESLWEGSRLGTLSRVCIIFYVSFPHERNKKRKLKKKGIVDEASRVKQSYAISGL